MRPILRAPRPARYPTLTARARVEHRVEDRALPRLALLQRLLGLPLPAAVARLRELAVDQLVVGFGVR
jgi:hypothetical protein